MTKEKIYELVKKIEPLFLDFSAHEDRLKNSNGMELRFYCDWKEKTSVSGLHAKHRHSIGCSFEKPIEKIFKDIRKRLMPNYHADFFETKRELIERAEHDKENSMKLMALSSVIGGSIERHYGYRNSSNNEYIHADKIEIYQTYHGLYEFNLKLSYLESMKLANILKNSLILPKVDLSKNNDADFIN